MNIIVSKHKTEFPSISCKCHAVVAHFQVLPVSKYYHLTSFSSEDNFNFGFKDLENAKHYT